MTRKHDAAGELLINQLDSYSIVYADLEYGKIMMDFSLHIIIQKFLW